MKTSQKSAIGFLSENPKELELSFTEAVKNGMTCF